jgi:hypothetical protein
MMNLESICAEWYDGDAPGPGTHTCDLPAGHDGLHHCPRCGSAWVRAEVSGDE